MNFAKVVDYHAQHHSLRPALRDRAMRFTYAELRDASSRLGTVLRSGGVQPGDRIGVVAENSALMAVLYLATLRIGAIWAPLNYRLTPREIQEMSAVIEPAIFVSDENHINRLHAMNPTLLGELVERSRNVQPLCEVTPVEWSSGNVILATSGTTGLPKGALVTHGNVFASCANIIYHQRFTDRDSTLIVLPLYHTAGLHLQLTPLWYAGGEADICERWDPELVTWRLRREEVTTLFLVNEQWDMLMPLLKGQQFHLREPVAGGVRLRSDTLEAIEEVFGTPPSSISGMTEASPLIFYLPPRHMRRKNGTLGLPTLWTDLRIVDDDLRELGIGQVGEMCYRGPLIMREYWRQPDETKVAFDKDGYFHSGDLEVMDEEGFVTLVDRKKDMIRTGAENVFSIEVEKVLRQHPAIRDVAVVGIPHEWWGEGVAAVVVLASGASLTLAEVQEFCKQHIASYKKPVHLEVVTELPRNLTGKVLKHELRRQLRAKLGDDAGEQSPSTPTLAER